MPDFNIDPQPICIMLSFQNNCKEVLHEYGEVHLEHILFKDSVNEGIF